MVALADVRTSTLTYAAGDVVGYVSPLGVTPPASVLSPVLNPPWYCMGWLDTGGYIFKLAETMKEIMAAGTLSAIRTIISAEAKTFDATFLEPLNPWVRALYDDVPIASLTPQVPRTDSTGVNRTSGSTTVGDTNALAGDVGQPVSGTGIPSGATISSVTAARVDSTGTSTTSGSATVADSHAVSGDLNLPISGTGIPASTTIIAVSAGVGYTISANATATGTPTLTIGPGYVISAAATSTGTSALTVGTSSQVAYLLPEIRAANEYAFLFDSIDGDRRNRLFGVRGMITGRGNDQVQQADNEDLQMTISLYPDDITFNSETQRGTCIRYLDYGAENTSLSGYFPS
jgi:hypothetical protein